MKTQPKREGLSLMETLVSVTIVAVLLTSVAATFQASSTSYAENATASELTQIQRHVLDPMMKEIRQAYDVDSGTNTLLILSDATRLNGVRYATLSGQFYRIAIVNGQQTSTTLIGNGEDVLVTAFTIVREEQAGKTVSAAVTLELANGTRTYKITSSASVRANQAQ